MKFEYENFSADDLELIAQILSAADLIENQIEEKRETVTPDSPFMSTKIINKKIEVFELPIYFSPAALLLVCILTKEVPGKAVVVLIDSLTKYADQVVTAQKLLDLYPNGFYTQASFEDYVENIIKPRKIKWAEIY